MATWLLTQPDLRTELLRLKDARGRVLAELDRDNPGFAFSVLNPNEWLGGRLLSRQPGWFTVGRFAQSWATLAKEAGIGATSTVQLVVESRALRGRTLNFKPVATFDAWEFGPVWIPGTDSKRYPVGDDGTINVLADGRTIAKGLPSVSRIGVRGMRRGTHPTDTTVATELTDNDPRPLNDCILLACSKLLPTPLTNRIVQ